MLDARVSPIQDLLNNELESILKATGVLSRIWRLCLADLGVNYMRWSSNLDDYVNECKELYPDVKNGNAKGNLGKALAKNEVSWNIFCKGISILKLKNPVFVTEVVLGKVTKEYCIAIPFTAEETRGEYLQVVWKTLKDDFKEHYKDWDKLVSNYGDMQRKYGNGLASSLRSSLTTALKADKLMWSVFSRGIEVSAFDKVTFKFRFKVGNKQREIKLDVVA